MTKILRDFSHWNIIYDYPAVAASADAFWLKCYDLEIPGGNGEDPAHDDHFAGLSTKPIGEYLFLDPHGSPRNQVLGYMKHSYRGIFDVLDAEDKEGMTPRQLTNSVIATFEAGWTEAKRRWWLYANLDWLNNTLLEPKKIMDLVEGIILAWPAPTATRPRMPVHYPPELVKMWQYTWWAQVPGISGPTDASKWLGTDEEWNALVGGVAQPTEVTVTVAKKADIIHIHRG